MAKTTKIVVGRVGDGLISTATAVTDETFTSAFDVPVNMLQGWTQRGTGQGNKTLIVASSVSVTNTAKDATYTENTDYTIDYAHGTVTVLSTGTMSDATDYYINYSWVIPNLAYKVNLITTGASNIYSLCTCRAGQNGVAVVVYD
jgi:hypothetical protein